MHLTISIVFITKSRKECPDGGGWGWLSFCFTANSKVCVASLQFLSEEVAISGERESFSAGSTKG